MRGKSRTHHRSGRVPFDCVALLLQGGGALGAYQAGVYEALSEADLHPDWVAGISIGAINSALITGNAPQERVGRLRAFWEQVTTDPYPGWSALIQPAVAGDMAHKLINQFSAGRALVSGAPGFFVPRPVIPQLAPPGSIGATSYYDTTPLKATLERLVDFDRLNHDGTRLSVGAVNVRTGNFVYFDTTTHVIRPEHIMASGALPPGFPPVEIEGEFYWDGGLVSNTPLSWVMNSEPRQDTLAFQVDLWNARGDFPRDLAAVGVRQKEIQFSSRTRANSDSFEHMQQMRSALASLLHKLPPELKQTPEYEFLAGEADQKVYNLIQLIYRAQNYEGDSKDYEFSRLTMEEHWRAGYHDAVRTLRHKEVLERPHNLEGVFTFDLAVQGRE
ncbi:MAG TPA: patatin-like phospholipase family protein [Aliidongia sp.]|nr:patatin-like phospholipase family protein [Aliidongia sp.]